MRAFKLSFILATAILLGTFYAVEALTTPQAAWGTYKTLLTSHPILTKSVTSGIIAGISDTISQRVEAQIASQELTIEDKPVFRHDWVRSTHILITGFIYSGPISHYWYAVLEMIVKVKSPILGLLSRSTLDALIFSPVTIFGYFSVRTLLEGKGLVAIKEKLQTTWLKALLGAWRFWPLANMINFGFVPVPFRVLYNNIMSLFWTGYLSFVNATRQRPEPNPRTKLA